MLRKMIESMAATRWRGRPLVARVVRRDHRALIAKRGPHYMHLYVWYTVLYISTMLRGMPRTYSVGYTSCRDPWSAPAEWSNASNA